MERNSQQNGELHQITAPAPTSDELAISNGIERRWVRNERSTTPPPGASPASSTVATLLKKHWRASPRRPAHPRPRLHSNHTTNYQHGDLDTQNGPSNK